MIIFKRYIALLFVLLIGILSIVYAYVLLHDASKNSIEKSTVEYERFKSWEILLKEGDPIAKIFRPSTIKIQKLVNYIQEEKANISNVINKFNNTNYPVKYL